MKVYEVTAFVAGESKEAAKELLKQATAGNPLIGFDGAYPVLLAARELKENEAKTSEPAS